MPGGPVVIIIDPDEPDNEESLDAVALRLEQTDAERIRALADRVEAGEVQVRFAR